MQRRPVKKTLQRSAQQLGMRYVIFAYRSVRAAQQLKDILGVYEKSSCSGSSASFSNSKRKVCFLFVICPLLGVTF
jgi:hypothetical protein